MSKSSELDKFIKKYIIDHIDGSGYDLPEIEGEAAKVKFLRDTFRAEYGWHADRVGEIKALTEWFAGLPSSCTVAFYNDEILALAEQWGYLDKDAPPHKQQRILDNWFNLVANKTAQLFKSHRAAV